MRIFLGALLSALLCLSPWAQAKEVHPKHHAAAHRGHHAVRGVTVGLASWYGLHEQGMRMANGQRFDRFKYTAASRTLPFGTHLRVTNLSNGRSTVVTVTDRGPWVRTRVLDLAQRPAHDIGCLGTCRVQLIAVSGSPT